MGKKRKPEANRLEEADRTMHLAFRGAANSLSHLYSLSANQHKLAFQAAERHALEKLYLWIIRQHEEGSNLSPSDIVAHLQREMDYGGDEASASPRSQVSHQHTQPTIPFANVGMQASSGVSGQASIGLPARAGQSEQAKNSVFSTALSSPVPRTLQPYQVTHGEFYQSAALLGGTNARHREPSPNQESDSPSWSDSMDIH